MSVCLCLCVSKPKCRVLKTCFSVVFWQMFVSMFYVCTTESAKSLNYIAADAAAQVQMWYGMV